MGVANFLVEGVSATGKTTVCTELQRRGHHAIQGDRELAFQGTPDTGEATEGFTHEHHIWRVDRVEALAADHEHPMTFVCGGSRNFARFIDLFDAVFVLEIDAETLHRRLDDRSRDEWGGSHEQRELVVRLHRTQEDVPAHGIRIDATGPLADVVDEIVSRATAIARRVSGT